MNERTNIENGWRDGHRRVAEGGKGKAGEKYPPRDFSLPLARAASPRLSLVRVTCVREAWFSFDYRYGMHLRPHNAPTRRHVRPQSGVSGCPSVLTRYFTSRGRTLPFTPFTRPTSTVINGILKYRREVLIVMHLRIGDSCEINRMIHINVFICNNVYICFFINGILYLIVLFVQSRHKL